MFVFEIIYYKFYKLNIIIFQIIVLLHIKKMVKYVTDSAEFDNIIQTSKAVVVDFTATWYE